MAALLGVVFTPHIINRFGHSGRFGTGWDQLCMQVVEQEMNEETVEEEFEGDLVHLLNVWDKASHALVTQTSCIKAYKGFLEKWMPKKR